MSATFEARYSGRCQAECGIRIDVGDPVKFTDEGLVHEDCDGAEPTERPVVACNSCWLVQPCDCDV